LLHIFVLWLASLMASCLDPKTSRTMDMQSKLPSSSYTRLCILALHSSDLKQSLLVYRYLYSLDLPPLVSSFCILGPNISRILRCKAKEQFALHFSDFKQMLSPFPYPFLSWLCIFLLLLCLIVKFLFRHCPHNFVNLDM
jgi:hypothetical protein